MQCIRPSLIRNPAWNGLIDSPQSFMVPCGRCVGCRIARTREWSIRLYHELPYYQASIFVTLTYSDDNLPVDVGLHKDDLQRFFKRLRRRLGERKIKYFACGEYGDNTYRPHYHCIIFGLDPKERYLVDECWRYGFNTIGTVTYDSIKYVCGYVQKKLYGKDAEVYEGREVPFCINSSGLGLQYCLDNAEKLKKDMYVTVRGTKLSLPRYYRKVLEIDTLDYYESTAEHRQEVEDIFESRIPKGAMTQEEHDFYLLEQRHISRLQYEKNMKGQLSLKERSKL